MEVGRSRDVLRKGDIFVIHLGFAFGGLLGSVRLGGLRRFLLPLAFGWGGFQPGEFALIRQAETVRAPSVLFVGLSATPLIPSDKKCGWWGWWWLFPFTPLLE